MLVGTSTLSPEGVVGVRQTPRYLVDADSIRYRTWISVPNQTCISGGHPKKHEGRWWPIINGILSHLDDGAPQIFGLPGG